MRELEQRFGPELVVVGVHAGKFIAERVTANIREAVLRLDIRHPVLNDRQYRTWRAYAVNAWPTLVLVDARGYVVGQHAGEITADQLAPAIARAVEAAERDGTLDRTPLALPPETAAPRALLYPQKVTLDAAGERLAIADTGQHRVLVARLDADGRRARLETVLGDEPGFADGPPGEARFRAPHGLAFAGQTDGLWVADTENHAVRAVDLVSGTVRTLAGSGTQSRRWPPAPGVGPGVALNSPWDLLEHEGVLYVAMAGCHQLWKLDPVSGHAQPWVGSGAEALRDGAANAAALAQPSALALGGNRLWFADGESSAIRWTGLEDGATGTVVGTGLFDFGDRDGLGDDVRLQHPLGVAWSDGMLLVADTYNSALKWLDPVARSVRRWEAAGEGGLWEPGGVAVAAGRIAVADTNHHRVLVGRPGGALEELSIDGLEAPGD